DVYVAKKTNRYGEPYGFVRFSNVKNVTKMTKALNAVWFGHYRVRASVAIFDRHYLGEDKRPEKEKVGASKGADETLKKDGSKDPMKPVLPEGGVASTFLKGSKTHGG
ncbi:hypothetical protein A2U01_0059334, partial [Trifolium medium]|nr:hypothetical protein [Trifolium medium]